MIFIDENLDVVLVMLFWFDSYSYCEVMAVGRDRIGFMGVVFCFFGGFVGGGEERRIIGFGFLLFVHLYNFFKNN
jgi:hypothetical protein